jgi:hypothetical protein
MGQNLESVGEYMENKTEKIAHICWNSNGWISPSGSKGKNQNMN